MTVLKKATDNGTDLILFRLACLLPTATLLLFYSFVLRARLSLGQWPQPYRPDPAELGFDLHMWLINWSFVVLFASPFMVAASVVFSPQFYLRRRPQQAMLVFFMASLIAALLILRSDPGQFVVWFGD